jgi:hypothetical protein
MTGPADMFFKDQWGTPRMTSEPQQAQQAQQAPDSQWDTLRTDGVNHPWWYRSSNGIEAIEVVEGFRLTYNLGEAVVHILRAGRKPGHSRLLDLREAEWHLKREIDNEKHKKNPND